MNRDKGKTDRQDFVDNAIFDLIIRLNPNEKEIDWDIDMIGSIRDEIKMWLVDRLALCDEEAFYP